MQKLVQGIHRFQTSYFSSQKELFERLSKGQSPETLFIACSDSRISPTLLTQSQPGDLFILRNAGNIVPPYRASNGGESATIEYAVQMLGVRDIVVCGHSLCGAVKALLRPEDLDGMPALREWLLQAETTRRIIREKYAERDEAAQHVSAIEENVLVQLDNLRTHPCVAAKLSTGGIHLHGWVYKIETGQVFGYNPIEGQFLSLTDRQ
jgi:carbonic anhydrase